MLALSANDLVLSVALFACFVVTAQFVARRARLSLTPVLFSVPALIVVGTLLYLPGSPLFTISDGIFYQAWASDIAAGWAGQAEPSSTQVWPGKGVWPTIIAVFTFFFGPVTLALVTLNACIFGLSVMVTQGSVRLLTGEDSPGWVLFFALTSTPFLLFAPSLLRESIYWLGFSLGVMSILSIKAHRPSFSGLTFMASAVLVLAVRPDVGAVFAFSTAGAMVLLLGFSGSPRTSRSARFGSLAVLVALIGTFPPTLNFLSPEIAANRVVATGINLNDGDAASGFSASPEADEVSELSGEDAASGFSASKASELQEFCDRFLPAAVACNGIRNLPYALFGPFHWEYGWSPIWPIAGASTLHFLALLFGVTVALARSPSVRFRGFLLAGIAAALMVLYASVLTNYGILIRFRASVEIILLPLAVAGMKIVFRSKEKKLAR